MTRYTEMKNNTWYMDTTKSNLEDIGHDMT